MKTKLFSLLLLTITFNIFAQINPVQNLSWTHIYGDQGGAAPMGFNAFDLHWDEPAQPHDQILGYNIYRNGVLYGFQTDRFLYNRYNIVMATVETNCTEGGGFITYNDCQGFTIYVTAVYSPNNTESGHVQSATVMGCALSSTNFNQEKSQVYPNPTAGIINLKNLNTQKLSLYDISGKLIKEFEGGTSQIDLTNFSKGMYLIKLFSEEGVIIDKIIVE